jgi:thiosulfate/3-mercaptopyruvate sulfurtransferase
MNLPLLISPAQLSAHLGHKHLVVLDISDNYLAGHIPGACSLSYGHLLLGKEPVANDIPTVDQLTHLLQMLGVTPDTYVVVYDDQYSASAARLVWTWHMLGNTKISCLNGGLHAWITAGLEIETITNLPHATTIGHKLEYTEQYIIDHHSIDTHLDDNSLSIWDTRTRAEYNGDKVLAQKGGHIPGAVHCEWTNCLDNTGKIKPPEQIVELLHTCGIDTSKTIVPYCQSHRRSSLAYLATRSAGIDNIKCYAGSWNEWGNLADARVDI